MSLRSFNRALYGLDRCRKNAAVLVSSCVQAIQDGDQEKAHAIASGKVFNFMLDSKASYLLWRWLEE